MCYSNEKFQHEGCMMLYIIITLAIILMVYDEYHVTINATIHKILHWLDRKLFF